MDRLNQLSKRKFAVSPYRSSYSKAEEANEPQPPTRVSRTQKDVQDLEVGKVAGVGEGTQTALDQYKDLFEGIDLEFMKDEVFQKDHQGFSALGQEENPDETTSVDQNSSSSSSSGQTLTGEPLTQDEQAEVDRLKARDQEVRTHEQAHVAAGGRYITGGISYEYQQGPDGRRYAVGGHVNIDVSEASTPEETVQKMRQVRRAALAPAEPSGADRAVASEASKKEQRAQAELNQERLEDPNERKDQIKGEKSDSTQKTEGPESENQEFGTRERVKKERKASSYHRQNASSTSQITALKPPRF